jgi:hypothetical protein
VPITFVLGKVRPRSVSTGDFGFGGETTKSTVDQGQIVCSLELAKELYRLSKKRTGVC